MVVFIFIPYTHESESHRGGLFKQLDRRKGCGGVILVGTAAGMSVARRVLTISVAAGCVGVAVGEDIVGYSHKAGGIKGILRSVRVFQHWLCS